MAQQLLQDRTPAAYAGVEAYARRRGGEDAGALAWLVLGYAHWLDHDLPKTMDALTRAKPLAGDLGDYVTYYLAASYFQSGQITEADSSLNDFDQRYPDSLSNRDAHVLYANVLLAENKAKEAIALLEKDRQPTRADVELVLGKAYAAVGDQTKAAGILSNLYITMPLSPEATQAEVEIAKVPAELQSRTIGVQGRRTRADLLMKGKRFNDAANEYRTLTDQVSASDKPAVQLTLAVALRRSGQDKEAKKILETLPSSTTEMNAERLFNLGEIARSSNNDDEFLRILGDLRQAAPSSQWMEQALLSAGNIYLLKKDYDKAIDQYRELQQRFPNGSRAPYAHWKTAWLSLRQGRNAEARSGFEQQIALYPGSAEVPAALYWRGRLAEEENDFGTARAYYQKISEPTANEDQSRGRSSTPCPTGPGSSNQGRNEGRCR